MQKIKEDYQVVIKDFEKKGEVFPATLDSVFKSLIQDEQLKDFTAFLISNCNGRIIEKEDIIFVNTEGTKNTLFDRVNVHDVLININNNRISLEMNRSDSRKLRKRNISHFYEAAGKTINVSYRLGNELYYEQINFDGFDNGDDLISSYKILNTKNGREDPDENNFIKYRINLALIYKKYYTYGKELTRFEKALAILSFNKVKDLRKVAKGDEMLMRIEKKIEDLTSNPDLVRYIDDEKAMEFGHKLDVEDAHNSGKKEKSIEIAKKMYAEGSEIDFISRVTDLSEDEINKLVM